MLLHLFDRYYYNCHVVLSILRYHNNTYVYVSVLSMIHFALKWMNAVDCRLQIKGYMFYYQLIVCVCPI